MASRWIVKRGDKERGPFTSPQLKSLADSGQLRRTDLVTKQGEDRYVPAEKVKGLFLPEANSSRKDARAKSKTSAKSKASDDDEKLDFGVVEIIEDDDPVVVLEESEDEFALVEFDEDEDDLDEPEPRGSRRSGGSHRESPRKGGRNSSAPRRAVARTKPSKPKKPVKKTGSEEEDEDENSPWLNVVYGLACVFGGICFFVAMANEDPNTWESRRNAAVLAVVKVLYNIGGRWMVLGLAIALSGLFFWSAYNQFRKA